MAVNLRATATLNTKPFTAGIKSIKAATESLNKSAASGSAAVTSNVLAQKAATEAASKAVRQNQQAVTTAGASNVRAINQTSQSLDDYNKLQQESVKVSRQIANAYQTMSRADANHYANKKKLAQQRLALLRAEDSGIKGPALQPYIDRVGRAEIAAAKSRATLTAATERQTAANNRLAASQARVGSTGAFAASGLAAQRYMFHDLSRQLATAALGFAALPALSIGVAAAWEKMFSDVRRTADPAFIDVETRVDALRNSLVGMVQAMPIGFGAVTEIATLANQMGIASSQTADFTRAVAMFSATSGVSVDIAATAFGRLTSIMGDSRIGFMEMADSILKVGVNSVATEGEIINVTTQISSIAAQAGMSTKDIIALSGALASVRVPPELSRGVITRVFGQIDKAVNEGSTGLQTLARLSGVSADQFRKDWGTERASGLFNGFLHGLKDAGSAARSELASLGITSVRDQPVLLRLSNAADSDGNVGELYTQTMRDANDAAGETQRQYTIMAETVVSKLKMLGNNILAFFDAAGSSGLGVFGDVIDGLTKNIRNFTRSLEEPHALLGMFGATNSDVVGFVGVVLAGVSAFTLLGSATAKVFAATRTMEHAGSLLGIFGAGGAKGAAGGVTAFAGGMGKAAGAAGGLFGGLSKVGGFLLGPWGIALTVGLTALGMLNSAMQAGVTESSKLAESLASIDYTYAEDLNKVISGITVAGPDDFLGFELNTKPFSNGVADIGSALDELMRLREANSYDWFGGKQVFQFGEWLDRTVQGQWDEIDGIKKLDEAVQGLVDGGNGIKAAQMLQGIARSGQDLTDIMSLSEGANIKAFLRDSFALAEIEMTDENLNKLANGTLPELTDAMAGVKGSTIAAEDIFEGDFERLAQFAQVFDDAAASFVDFNAALEAGTQLDEEGAFVGFDLNQWSTTLNQQVADQEAWANNLVTITRYGSTEAIEALANMGPAGKEAVAALAAGLVAGDEAAINALASLEASVLAQAAGLGNSVAEIMANIDWVKGASSSAAVSEQLLNMFTDTDLATLRTYGQGLGKETIAGVLDGLAERGNVEGSLEQAFNELLAARPKVEVPIEFTQGGVEQGIAGLQAKLRKQLPEVDVQINTKTTVAQLRGLLNDPVLNAMDIDANLTLTEAYAEVTSFQAWAELNGVDMYLGVNDLPARVTTNTMVDYANGLVGTIQLNALDTLAEGELWEFVKLADETTGFVKIDGNKDLLEQKLYQVDSMTGEVQTVPIDGDEAEALQAIIRTRDATKEPATIGVDANTDAFDAAVADRTGNIGSATISLSYVDSNDPYATGRANYAEYQGDNAYGNVYEAYAKGGVREDHRPQIAPAGAMRLWAEPETGGEAYIPFAKDRRKRAEGILNDVAGRFGYSLVKGSNVAQFANGGQYMAQAMARSQRSYAVQGSASSRGVSIGEVTFTDSTQKDQFREFTRTLNRVARGNR